MTALGGFLIGLYVGSVLTMIAISIMVDRR